MLNDAIRIESHCARAVIGWFIWPKCCAINQRVAPPLQGLESPGACFSKDPVT